MTPSPSTSNLARLAKEATARPWRTETHGRSDDNVFGAHYIFAKDSPYPLSAGSDEQPDGFRSLHGRSAPFYKADADFIVSAANSHDALLEVARCAQAVAGLYGGHPDLEQLRAALTALERHEVK